LAVGAEDVGDQEIAARKSRLIFIHGDADMQSLTDQVPILFREAGIRLFQTREGGLAPEFENDVVLHAGDEQRRTDRPTALRDDRMPARAAAQNDAHAASPEPSARPKQSVFAGAPP